MLLAFLLISELLIDGLRYLHRFNMLIGVDAIHGSGPAICVFEHIGRSPGRLVEQKRPLNLILSFFITRRRRLVAYVPPVVVNIARIRTSVSRLWFRFRKFFISKALLNHEPLMLILKILEVIANFILIRQLHTSGPPCMLDSKEVLVNFILDDLSYHSRLRVCVRVLIEELVLHRIVHLSILYAADGFARTIGRGLKNILTCTRKQRSLGHLVCLIHDAGAGR